MPDSVVSFDDAETLRAELMGRVAKVAPLLRARADETNRDRRVSEEIIGAYWDAGLFNLFRPRKFGGPEIRLDIGVDVATELARTDGSSAWVWIILAAHDTLACYFPEEAQQEFWDKPRTMMASSFAPSGKGAPAEGGLRLTGKWSFCSGIDNSQWLMLGAITGMTDRGPDMSYVLVPRSDFTIVDDWHVMGLRGTGSKSAVVDNVFVPPHRIVRVADTATGQAPGAQVHDNPLYRAPMLAFFPFFIASPAAGIARGAFEAFIDDMKVKTGGYDKSPMAKKPGIQMRVAEAGALIDAADLLFKRSLRETMAKIFAGEELSLEHRVRSRRDQAYSISMARHAAEILFSASGARALYDTNRTQRAYRDLQAVSAHAVSTWDGPALNYGQVMLGGTPSEFAY